MHFVLFLVFGLVVGALARFIVPGREPGGWVVSMIIGVAGSFFGAMLGRASGCTTRASPQGSSCP